MKLSSSNYLAMFLCLVVACQSEKKEEVTQPKVIEKKEPSIVVVESRKRDVYDALSAAGFMIEKKGKIRLREDAIVNVPLDSLSSFVEVLSWRSSKDDELAMYMLKVAGAANEDKTKASEFIKSSVLTGEYLEDLKRMHIYILRQPRPMIRTAVHNIVDELTTGQCIAYLDKIGYAKGRKGNMEFNPEKLKYMSTNFRVMLLNKLINDPSKGKEIASQLKTDLGVNE